MLSVLLISLIVIAIALMLAVYRKLSKAIQTLRHEAVDHSGNVIRQIEGLLAVHAEVRPVRALPKSRGWAASPDLLGLLIANAQQRQPVTVLECSSGLSTVVLAACLRNLGRGKVFSLEHDTAYAEKTRRLLRLHDLAEWATVVDAPLVAHAVNDWRGTWYDTMTLPPSLQVDMLVIDGPPHDTSPLARYPALPLLHASQAPAALIVLDDASRPDEMLTVARWLAEHSDLQRIQAPDCEKGCAMLQKRTAAG